MKIDRSKLKKYLPEPPADCKLFIDKLKSCDRKELHELLKPITIWHIGKCELYHWIDALDLFDSILEEACVKLGTWMLNCDKPEYAELKFLVLDILHFTALLIEHSYSRHLYNSIEYLIMLLQSSDVHIVLAVLSLLYVFSKRSNFITRLQLDKKQALIGRLIFLAETWGGRENGFDLARCCSVRNPSDFPEHATNLHFAYTLPSESTSTNGPTLQISKQIDVPNVHLTGSNAAAVMEMVLAEHKLPEDKQIKLFTHLRLAYAFPSFEQRLLCIQARLQALSILVYSAAIQEANNVLYDGLIEELVEVLNVRDPTLTDIKASALKTLTSIIHLERTTKHPPRLQEIIEATQANSYHGFLPALVRQCIDRLTDDNNERFPQSLSTALFSFLYHLASYETGGDALVNCGIMQSLIKVVNYYDESQDFIMFVTRAVRVIDLITTLDMTSFQTNNGLQAFINRLEHEISQCRKEQPYIIRVPKQHQGGTPTSHNDAHPPLSPSARSDVSGEHPPATTASSNLTVHSSKDMDTSELFDENHDSIPLTPIPGLTCYHQRAALLKSILNYLKKAFAEPTMADATRHIMDGSLPNSLKHIISNAEYYGPSLFHLATDVVTSFIFQEPSQLSSLQDNGLTDVLMHALLKKDVPAARDVLASLPNIFSALCLNTRGLENFMEYKPFEKLFRVLLSPEYLPAMRRRRGTDTIYGTASSLGNAVDELMRHQVSLRTEAMKSIIVLLEQLVEMGNNPKYCCQKAHSSSSSTLASATKLTDTIRHQHRTVRTTNTTNTNAAGNDRNSSDDEYDDDEATNDEAPLANRSTTPTATAAATTTTDTVSPNMITEVLPIVPIVLNETSSSEKKSDEDSGPMAVPLLDYITNIMRFVEGVISNNTTDDHGKEFVKLGGLKPLLEILQMKNLPIDFPSSQACQCVAALCKSTLTLLVKDNKLIEMVISNLDTILSSLTDFYVNRTYDGSLLIEELARAMSSSSTTTTTTNGTNPIDPLDAINQSSLTPLLHQLSVVHSHISLLISLCKITQSEVRSILINFWGAETGLRVLKNLNKLCLTLIWESSILLSLLSSETNLTDQEFNKNDLLKVFPLINDLTNQISPLQNVSSQLNDLTTNEMSRAFDIDEIMSMDTNDLTKLKLSFNIQQRIKTIKPLLCVSSKLGKALGELYNLLVRTCSTSQMRHARRFNHQPAVYTPTVAAKQVASTLTEVLRDGFLFQLPSTMHLTEQQIEKFRLTFFVCTIGFATPMLFDERRRPYMLMLQQFESSKAQEALFSALEWTLDLINRSSLTQEQQSDSSLTNNKYDASPTEFLNSALMLILRLVNVKSILESPHAIPKKVQTERTYYVPFNPLHYLAMTHKCAFNILTNSCSVLWDKPYLLKDHATKIIDSILSIFCHILRGESQIQKKLQSEEQQQQPGATSAVQPVPSSTAAVPTAEPTVVAPSQQAERPTEGDLPGAAASSMQTNAAPLNEAFIQSITMMGFSREHAIEGLLQTNHNLELAVDYCVNHPQAATTEPASNPVPEMDADMARALLLSLGQEVDEAALANPIAALSALSRESNPTEAAVQPPTNTRPAEPAPVDPVPTARALSPLIEPLSKESVDHFTNSIMLKILDILPDTVYKMCELVVTTMHRNGNSWRDQFLEIIAGDIQSSYRSLIDLLDRSSSSSDEKSRTIFLDDPQNSVLFSRTLLISLLFEEMPFPCARIAEKFSLIPHFCSLIHRTTEYLTRLDEKKTPTWIAPTFIFIDLYEKVSLASKRRAVINQTYRDGQRVWQWFDERAVRWNNYPSAQNKEIDEAYANGEPTCKIVIQRRNYLIQFNTMLQINEETHNKRPIMLTFAKPATKPTTNADGSTQNQPSAGSTAQPHSSSSDSSADEDEDDDEDDDDDDSDDERRPRRHGGAAARSRATRSKKVESMDTEQQTQEIHASTTIISSLADDHALTLTSDCVHLIRMPVDPDAIHALLRLILRLTRDYKYARQFAKSGGIQGILSLTQTSAFQGCASLITLIFRHIMEDDNNLRLAMEKAIRQALTGNHGGSIGVQPACPGSRELNVILRILGPAMTRAPDIFLDVASNVLQLLPPSAGRLPSSVSRFTNPFLTNDDENPHHAQSNMPVGPLILQARPATSQTTATAVEPSPSNTTESASQVRLVRPITTTTTTPDEPVGELAERLLVDLLDFLLTTDDINPKRLLSKSTILRILAELIRSYANVAKLVSSKTFHLQENTSCSALAYILDHLLPGTNTQQNDFDKDIPALCRLFLVAMAACNHCLESQMNLVNEVKTSLNKILVLPECDEKHLRLQALANIINTMIESCPAPNTSAPPQGQHRVPQLIINNMIKIMYKRGLINDLAKMIHSIELSSPKLADTVNAVLKPMERLSQAINYASSLHVPASARPHPSRQPTTTTTSTTTPSSTTTTSTTTAATTASTTAAQNNQIVHPSTLTTSGITTTDSVTPSQERTNAPRADQSHATSERSTMPSGQQRSSEPTTNTSQNNPPSSADQIDTPPLGSANQVALSISQEELLNATDMEPVADLPQDVDFFERNIHSAAGISTDDDEEDDDDDEDEIEEEASMEDEDGVVGSINVEFDVGHPLDTTHEHASSSSSTTTSGDQDEDDAEETDSPDEDIDMESANGNDREPQHRYSDDDEDITSEEEGDVRLTGPTSSGEVRDDEQDDDLDDDSDHSETDDTHTGDELDEHDVQTIDIHIETALSQSTDDNLSTDRDSRQQGNSTADQTTSDTANNNNNNTTRQADDEDEDEDDDDNDDDDDDDDDEEQDEDEFAEDDDAVGEDIEDLVNRDMDAAGAWQDDEEDDEDEDDEDESTEFEDDDGDIGDYVHEMEFDEEMLSEIRNNLMSPTDIDPILISNLQGVRIRATGFPPFHGMTDTVDPALPPPPMSVPPLHPLLVPHPDNQLSSGAFSRFRQLGTANTGATTTLVPNLGNPAGLPPQGHPASALAFAQPNGSNAAILTGQAALAAHQQITQQAQRNRTTRTLFIPGGATAFGRAAAGGFADYLQHVNQLDVDPLTGGAGANNGHGQGAATARILLGNGTDPDAWRFLHDQILMDIAPQANEGNENIDGTKIYMIRTPLARWMEESIVLDGPYVHDTVLALKSKITEPLEKQYEGELQVVLAKKAKDEEEKKKRAEEKARQEADRVQAAAAAAATATATSTAEQPSTENTATTAAQTTAEPTVSVSALIDEIQHAHDIAMTSPEQQRPAQISPLSEALQDIRTSPERQQTETEQAAGLIPPVSNDPGTSPLTTETMSTGGLSPAPLATSPTTAMEINHPSPPRQTATEPATSQTEANTTLTEPSAPPTASTATAAVIAAPPPVEPEVEWTTLVIDGREFRVPKALEIDPSFLAALPEEMRQEILTDQVRNFEREESQRRAQRAAAYAAANPTSQFNAPSADGSAADAFPARTNPNSAATATGAAAEALIGEMLGEINPEFISALPPEIRDELLAEHRRNAAAMNSANLPDSGPAEFLRTLQPHLRQQVLADMDESQIGALPEDIATEARALRAAMDTQQQQYMRDRMVRTQHDMMNMLTNTTHHSTRPIRMYNLRALQEARNNRNDRQTTNWYSLRTGGNPTDLTSHASNTGTRGRQLLDYESICCLLVLLFIDDTRLNFPRLQKVLKNLCHHTQTRQWIIKALLSIINKSTGRAEYEGPSSTPGAPTLVLKTPTSSQSQTTSGNEVQQVKNINPSWLTINFESAFGARTNVFKIQRLGQAKRHGPIQISVHAQACPIVCRQVLESLISLAKNFPEQFLPLPTHHAEQPALLPPNEPTTVSKGASPDKQLVATPSKSSPNPRDLSFWELLLKLDQSFNSRSNRSTTNPIQNLSSIVLTNANANPRATLTLNIHNQHEIDFDSSPLAALLLMLDHPILNKNNQLMDKLFKLLALISQSFQIHIIAKKEISPSPLATSTPMTTEPSTQLAGNTEPVNPLQQVNPATAAATAPPPPTNKLIVSDDQIVLGEQLDLVIKALISKSCTEDGLESATILLLNVSKINQATRDKVLHLLLNGIRLLGKDVSEEIRQLHWEVQDHLSRNRSNTTSAGNAPGNDDESSSTPIDESSKLLDSYRNIRSNTLSSTTADPNIKQQDLQLPAMVMLTSKTANQQFLLRILKVIIQLREATKKEQSDAQSHVDSELQALTRRLDNLRQSLRAYFPADTATDPSNEILQPIDHLSNRLEQMRTRLQTVLSSNTAEQRQQLFSQAETINDIQEIHRLIRQLESLIETFHEPPVSTTMSTRINDVLQMIPPSFPSLVNEPMDVGSSASTSENKLTDLLNINLLWDSLSECLLSLARLPDPHAVLVLQPAVEAFFLVHAADLENENEKQIKKKKDRETREALLHLECFGPAPTTNADDRGAPDEPVIAPSGSNDASTPTLTLRTGVSTTELPIDAQKFVEFARTHRTVLNQILRQSTQHLSEGPFHILTDYTSILDFDVKRKYFRHELDRLKENIRGEDLAVHVRRNNVFEDSYRELSRRSGEDWKHRFYIVFDGEEGQDAGGLLREWYSIIARSMFDPNYALFMINPGDRVTYMPNPLSHCNANHSQYFKFIGRIIAKAIFDNKYMDCYFTRSFYKHILGIPVRYTDMESVDLQFFKNLVLLLESDIHQLGLDLTFSLDASEFGVNKVIELIPNGSTIQVTNGNKHEYVRLVCQEKMIGSIREQVNSFLEGFYTIIPKSLISIFNEQELELLISGLPDIDIEDLKVNTEYHKYRPNSLQVQWFWRALRSLDKEDLAKFLQFVTGTSKVPLQGFAHLEGMNGAQKFQIHRDDRSTDRLPSAHTCFNQLDLPAYESYDKLRKMLLIAIRECAGFGFA